LEKLEKRNLGERGRRDVGRKKVTREKIKWKGRTEVTSGPNPRIFAK